MSKPQMTQIKSIAQLKKHCKENGGQAEFFVHLNGGLRSSKTIFHEGGKRFEVINEIDWSEESMTEAELKDSIIGEAIKKGAFYSYS